MKMHQNAAVLAGVVILAACGPQDTSKPGLTGLVRESFVQSSVSSCTQAAQRDPRNANVPASTVSTYCTCTSNYMADKISVDQMENVNKIVNTNPTEAQRMMQPIIDAAIAACRPAAAPAQ